jgi:hypothetical protein
VADGPTESGCCGGVSLLLKVSGRKLTGTSFFCGYGCEVRHCVYGSAEYSQRQSILESEWEARCLSVDKYFEADRANMRSGTVSGYRSAMAGG